MIFSSPDSEKANWETKHKSKKVSIPRPVGGLRVWDQSSGGYVSISPHMPGAPDNSNLAERQQFWDQFIGELRAALNPKYGEDFIDDCLNMDVSEVKLKYGF